MNQNEIKNLLSNQEFMNNIIETTQEDFFVSKKSPSYTLKECLENTDMRILKAMYINYKWVIKQGKVKIENPTKKEIIEIFLNELPALFKEYIPTITKEDNEILDDILEHNGRTKKCNTTLTNNGFLYGFIEKKKVIYIMPKEIIEIYKEEMKSDSLKENIKNKIEKEIIFYINAYTLLNGVIKKSDFEDLIVNYYSINIDKKEIANILKKNGFNIYKNKYYMFGNVNDEEALNLTLMLAENISLYKIDPINLSNYLEYINNLLEKISKITKQNEENIFNDVLITLFGIYADVEMVLDNIEESVSLNKNQRKQLYKLLDENFDEIRRWQFRGRTFDEYTRDNILENYLLEKRPKNPTLKNCLNALPKEIYEQILDYHMDDIDKEEELEECILEEFQMLIDCFEDEEDYNEFLELDGEEYDNSFIGEEEIQEGHVFLYKDQNKIKFCIPTEMKEILRNTKKENNRYFEEADPAEITKAYVLSYLASNGIISKKVLKDLLKNEHDITISTKDLDNLVKLCNGMIYKKDYYTIIDTDDEEMVKELLKAKDEFGDYKIIDLMEEDNAEELMVDELEEYITNTLKLELSETDMLIFLVLFLVKHGIFHELSFKEMLKQEEIKLTKKAINKIIEIVNNYKDDINVWVFNGYSINDMKEMEHEDCDCECCK